MIAHMIHLLLACSSLAHTTALQTHIYRHRSFGKNLALMSKVEKIVSEEKIDTASKTNDADYGCAYLENQDYSDGSKPASAFILGGTNFVRQSKGILEQAFARVGIVGKSYIPLSERPPGCLGFTLSNEEVKQAEKRRESRPGGKVDTNPVSRALYDVGCLFLDELFDERPIARFWFLETIARIPYFSYVSMLHLYESFGWWRGVELRKVHNAEEYNELHHLLIMESLGGNAIWSDRFLGYHVAIAYYWALNALFFFSPQAAYEFMELLEAHAVDTYTTFLKENKDRLRSLPPPQVAKSYYLSGDLYMFDDFQASRPVGSRRPPCDSLYDVFKNIAEDEAEHVKTMIACQDYARLGRLVVSPHLNYAESNKENMEAKRENWISWAESINDNNPTKSILEETE